MDIDLIDEFGKRWKLLEKKIFQSLSIPFSCVMFMLTVYFLGTVIVADPLHDAVLSRNFNLSVLQKAIKIAKDKDVKDSNGNTALHLSVIYNNLDAVNELISNNVTINIKNKDGNTPLHLAANNGNSIVVHLIFANNRKINAENTGLFSFLSNEKTGINEENGDDRTPLHLAAYNGDLGIAKILIENKAKVNKKDMEGKTALHLAADNGKFDIVKLLIENVENIDEKDAEGKTALHLAANNGKFDVVKLLIENIANVNEKDKQGTTVLHLAANSGNTDVVKLLIESNAALDTKNNEDQIPLHFAADNSEIVEYLIQKKSDALAKDKKGRTFVHQAAIKNYFRTLDLRNDLWNSAQVKLYPSYNADVDRDKRVDNDGNLPLHLAASNGNLKSVKVWVEHYNGGINSSNNEGKTPLILAILAQEEEVVEYLCSRYNVDVNQKDNNGLTAFDYASKLKYKHSSFIEKITGNDMDKIIQKKYTRILNRAIEEKRAMAKKKQEMKNDISKEESKKTSKEESTKEQKSNVEEARNKEVENSKINKKIEDVKQGITKINPEDLKDKEKEKPILVAVDKSLDELKNIQNNEMRRIKWIAILKIMAAAAPSPWNNLIVQVLEIMDENKCNAN